MTWRILTILSTLLIRLLYHLLLQSDKQKETIEGRGPVEATLRGRVTSNVASLSQDRAIPSESTYPSRVVQPPEETSLYSISH